MFMKHMLVRLSWAIVFFCSSFVASGQLNPCDGSCNANQHPYWPMSQGNKWTYRNSSTLSPVVMTIQPSPAAFNCAVNPLPVYMYKIDPTNYWASNNDANLRWFLGVKPNSDVITVGHYWFDFNEQPVYGTNYYRTAPPYDQDTFPANVMLRQMPGGALPSSVSIPMIYFGSDTNPDFSCMQNSQGPPYDTWNVTWSYQQISTPAYSGTVVLANILEQFSQLNELWYFAPNIGPVRITQINTGITLDLVDYQVFQSRNIVPNVQYRDLLIATAGTASGLNFDQWNYYGAQVTHQPGPAPEEVCMDPSIRGNLLTIDVYLNYLQNRGTSCSTDSWPQLAVIENLAQCNPGSCALSWDQWNYYYAAAGYGSAPAPESACQPTLSYNDDRLGSQTVTPNRWVLYSSREWYALVTYSQAGGACQ